MMEMLGANCSFVVTGAIMAYSLKPHYVISKMKGEKSLF